MNTKTKQNSKSQRQTPRERQTPKKQGPTSHMLRGKHHEQEYPETRMTD